MRKVPTLAAVAVLALAGCDGGGGADGPADTEVADGIAVETAVPVDVEPVGGSGVTGAARVVRADDRQVHVELELEGAEPDAAAIHAGECGDLGERLFGLEGRRTTVPVSLETLTNSPHAIAVEAGGEIVACGGIS